MASSNSSFPVVDGIPYFMHPQTLGTITELLPPSQTISVVVINVLLGITSIAQILESIKHFAVVDDVFSKSFATTLILQADSTFDTANLRAQLDSYKGFSAVYWSHPESDSRVLPSGPYFVRGNSIHQAWRLYEDELDSFIFSVIPDDVLNPKRYTVLNSISSNGIWRNIAVPSRLYAKPTREKPLAGARMGLKDIFRLEGVKLTMMSRPWIELYGPDEESADYTKKLVNLGAVIVGKTKMTSFASPEEPTDQWIDFHCPVNPRGDRYQSPASSSSGAAVALAGYSWLDFSIGGDSAGSVRAPAPCSGLFSLRPSFDSTSMRGIPVNTPLFDVVGQFGRSLEDLHYIVSHTFELDDKSIEYPSKILVPEEFYPLANEKQQAMTEDFITILENFLGVKRTSISIADIWAKSPPKEADGKPLLKYLEKSAFWALCHDYYHGFDQFREDYRQKFEKEAYVGPVVRFRWNVGKDVTPEEYEAYLTELKVFRSWFGQHIMSHDSRTLSNAILVMPYGSPDPEYRDEPSPAPGTFNTIAEKFISPILHAPQLVLPFAQMPYHSRISGRDEVRPIASTIIGAKGSDLMLIKLAKAAFEKALWPTVVNTGRYMYPVADNSRGVALPDAHSSQPRTFREVQEAVEAVQELEAPQGKLWVQTA